MSVKLKSPRDKNLRPISRETLLREKIEPAMNFYLLTYNALSFTYDSLTHFTNSLTNAFANF